jgi:hypothetical protein
MSYPKSDNRNDYDSTDNLPDSIKKEVLLLRSCNQVIHELEKCPGGPLRDNIESEIRLILAGSRTTSAEHVNVLTHEKSELERKIINLERQIDDLRDSGHVSKIETIGTDDRSCAIRVLIVLSILTALFLFRGSIVKFYSRDATIPEEKVEPSLKP